MRPRPGTLTRRTLVVAMDKVRFGKALGKGARSLWEAAEAAAAPDPNPRSQDAAAGPPVSVQQAAVHVMEAHRTVHTAKRQVRGAAKDAGKSMLAPVRKFSTVLWLQVTGSFFALVAMSLALGLWRMHSAVGMSHERAMVVAVAAVIFSYFSVTDFVRAARRDRR